MPEGDVIARAAARLQEALGGALITRVEGSNPAVRRSASRLVGGRVDEVRSHGKHLLIHLDNGLSIRTHLGMSGAWHVYRSGETWRRTYGAARLVLATDSVTAVCFSAPRIEVERRRVVESTIAHLGPDVAGAEFDEEEYLRRANGFASHRPVSDLLLSQSVLAGVGNAYKCEILFLERVHPATRVAAFDREGLLALARRAHRLLRANLDGSRRSTTGDRSRPVWVYGRAGKPCLRCGSLIQQAHMGDPLRYTTWCPTCQVRAGISG
jgi:endonuclease-8